MNRNCFVLLILLNDSYDESMLRFPTPLEENEETETVWIEKVVQVSQLIRNDMEEVCGYLDEVEDDPDEDIDFDYAIQVGGLVGGRTNRLAGAFIFSYLDYESGELSQAVKLRS